MNISIFGLGYVGSVTAVCLCKQGHHVVGIDLSEHKTRELKQGISPIVEAGLEELLAEALHEKRLDVTSNHEAALQATDVSIVCVGTPALESGSLDLSHVRKVCEQIAAGLEKQTRPHLILMRSTMLPGSTRDLVKRYFSSPSLQDRVTLAYCPEFLREGSAVFDFNNPALTVMGSVDGTPIPLAGELMGTADWFDWNGAELMKYACNYWHAVKVGFANEIGRLCQHAGIDSNRIMEAFVTDTRLNTSAYYMRPGTPFGGSCLPKDVSALTAFARQEGIDLPLLDAVLPTNRAHLELLLRLILQTGKRRVLILGLAFKENSDDLRGSPMVALAETLLERGLEVQIVDPNLKMERIQGANRQQVERRLPNLASLLVHDLAQAIVTCEVLVVAHKNIPIATLRERISPDHHVIDANGWSDLRSLPCNVVGLCWNEGS